MSLLAGDVRRLRRDGRRRHASARFAAAVANGRLGDDDRVVLLVTGSGLKTPDAVETAAGIAIDADVDELLAELGVAA